MKRLHIIGRKNSGKTTLIVELVSELTRRGYRVGTIKHTHHDHELDTPGKDSHLHRKAGSVAVGILTRGMSAVFLPQAIEQTDSDKYDQLDSMMSDCDIVLVEGDSHTIAPKIEVFRSINDDQSLAMSDSAIKAVVTDDALDINTAIWKRSDWNSIVENIELLMKLAPAKN